MNYLPKFRQKTADFIAGIIIINDLILGGILLLVHHFWSIPTLWLLIAFAIGGILLSMLISWLAAKYITEPMAIIAQAVNHISPEGESVPAPNTQTNIIGREIVTVLAKQIYQITTNTTRLTNMLEVKNIDLHNNVVAKNLPLPLFVLNHEMTIIFANEAALKYIQKSELDVINKNVNSVLNMSFEDENTFEAWLTHNHSEVIVASQKWDHVRLEVADAPKPLFFDLAAYYNKGNSYGYETMLILFDHTNQYAQSDNAMNYVALAVHELRTPLTLLRGYIEALEDHMSNKLTVEDSAFVKQMDAAAQQLVTFINNVLNVARINDDQFAIQLCEENWEEVINSAINDMKLRAAVQGITFDINIAPNLPTVAIDKVSIYEVISNLVDNAIKYSADSKKINITSLLNKDGIVETSVQDFGIGIPASAMPKLFDKFYRSHESRNQVIGTGLGLYLCKTIISAHKGNIWVDSKEGHGSTFSFTVLPYSMLPKTEGNDQSDNVSGVHAWIKNHNLYRR